MRVFALCASSSAKLSYLDSIMFHGRIVSDSSPNWRAMDACIGDPYQPLHLIRNIRILPDICMPTTTFVVSEELKQKLVPVCHGCELHRVYYDKLIDFPVLPIGSDYHESSEYREVIEQSSLKEIMDRLPDVSSRVSIGAYYELIEPRLTDVNQTYSNLKKYSIRATTTWTKKDVMLSSECINDYPVLFSSAHFFAERVFRNNRPIFEQDVFRGDRVRAGIGAGRRRKFDSHFDSRGSKCKEKIWSSMRRWCFERALRAPGL